jgi:phosphoglycolate phosphatase
MTLIKPTIVLFDMDGTTVRHINPALLHVLERLDDASHKIAKGCSQLFRRKIERMPLVEFRNGKRPKLLVHRALHKIRRKDVEEIVEPCPGIYDILDLLKANNIPMGLVSNGLGKGYGHDILEKFDLAKYFDVTIFREDITRSKPFPDPILQAVSGLKRAPEKSDVIWYIGDRRKDILAAIAAADYLPCPVQPLAYGLNSSIAVLEHNIGVDHIVMAYPDLELRLRALIK